MTATLTCSDASVCCGEVIPSRALASSRDAGWTSVFVDHHRYLLNEDVFETRATPDQTIVVMTRGGQDLEACNGGLWRRAIYQAGTVGMTPASHTDRLRWRARRTAVPVEKVTLYVPQGFFWETADHYRLAGQSAPDRPLTALAFDDPLIGPGILGLLRAMVAGAPDLYAQATMQWLATYLLSAHCGWRTMQDCCRNPGVIRDSRLARVIEYMSAHFDQAMMMDKLAPEAGVSKFRFALLFRARTGLTPYAFLIKLRMEAARHMLVSTELSVSTVATQCGFAQAAHLGTAFTKRFGVSPTTFRARSRS